MGLASVDPKEQRARDLAADQLALTVVLVDAAGVLELGPLTLVALAGLELGDIDFEPISEIYWNGSTSLQLWKQVAVQPDGSKVEMTWLNAWSRPAMPVIAAFIPPA